MRYFEWSVAVLIVGLAVFAAAHALLNKREPRAAMGWIGFCLVFPALGALAYFLFGINRIRTRARKLLDEHATSPLERPVDNGRAAAAKHLVPGERSELARISDAVSRHALVPGNALTVLHNGEEAYPAMLGAIERAESSVLLATYIFDANASGMRFIDAMARAVGRGVDVRVLLDGYGEIYSHPSAGRELRRRGIHLGLFLPPKLIPPTWQFNLRNHRKVLVTDTHQAFVGGMNIGDRHIVEHPEEAAGVVDVHFRLAGPVVAQIANVFCEDWEFATHEHPSLPSAPALPSAFGKATGEALCRTITDGPNEDLDRLLMILVAAIAAARHRILIMTPYFLPTREMVAVLQAAALRGVEVEVFLPGKNNLPYVHWATRNMLWQLLERGVRVYYQPPPFVHSKLFLIDDDYMIIGSSNLDPRSLRLNFELAVEVFDKGLAREVADHFDEARKRSREVTLGEVDGRPLPERLRDGVAWLFSPYL